MADAAHWSECVGALRELLARPHFGILSDFDGTLSHFAEFPDDAAMVPENGAALDRLAASGATVALISGRSAADLRRRFPRSGFQYSGNHGLDRWEGSAVATVEAAQPWETALGTLLTDLGTFDDPAILIENKGVTATLHYRATADPLAASEEIAARLTPLSEAYGLQLTRGNQVWELKPPLALNKGTALASIVAEAGLDGVLFLGDDTTDLLAMAELRRLRAPDDDGTVPIVGLSVGVIHGLGSPKELRDFCDMVANGPDDVARLLGWLADERAASAAVATANEGV